MESPTVVYLLPAGKMLTSQNAAVFRDTHSKHTVSTAGRSELSRRRAQAHILFFRFFPSAYLRKMMCVMTKAKMKMVRKESERMNM